MNVSVCMATFNGEKFIKKQLESILCQLGKNDEIVIVDDASDDRTVHIITGYNDARIKLIINKENIGFIRSFEKSIWMSKNDFVFLSDQDDYWYSSKVPVIRKLFPEYDLVIHNSRVVTIENKVISSKLFSKKIGKNFLTRHLTNDHNYGCMMAFNKKIIKNMFPFPGFIESHDQWIGINLSIYGGKIKFLDENMIDWIRHEKNTSTGFRVRRNIKDIILTRILKINMYLYAYLRKILN